MRYTQALFRQLQRYAVRFRDPWCCPPDTTHHTSEAQRSIEPHQFVLLVAQIPEVRGR